MVYTRTPGIPDWHATVLDATPAELHRQAAKQGRSWAPTPRRSSAAPSISRPTSWPASVTSAPFGAPLPITDELRDQLRRDYGGERLAAFEAWVATRQPRRWAALFWEPAGDELAWTDGQSGGAGQLDHWIWLDWLHGRGQVGGPIWAWLVEHQVDLGSSESPATHALVVDRQTNRAWVAPMATARAIVRAQRLELLPLR